MGPAQSGNEVLSIYEWRQKVCANNVKKKKIVQPVLKIGASTGAHDMNKGDIVDETEPATLLTLSTKVKTHNEQTLSRDIFLMLYLRGEN